MALEGTVGNFEPVNDRALILDGKGTLAANDDRPGFEGHLESVRRDAGKGDAERQTIRRLVQVDGRLPARCPRGTDLEEPALQLLCPTKQLQRFGPHP